MQGIEHTAGRRPRTLATCLREPGGLFARVFARLVVWSERHRARVRLRDLDDRGLRDVGLTREAVERESSRPFWMP